MKTSLKFDKFYIVLVITALTLTVLVAFVLRSVFSAINLATSLPSEVLETNETHIVGAKVDQAIKILNERKIGVLDLKD